MIYVLDTNALSALMKGSAAVVERLAGYDDSGAFCFFTWTLRAAQYLRMRSDIARRFAGVSRCVLSRRLSAGSFGFAGRVTLVGRDDASELAEVDRFVATVLAAARFGFAGAISMPNISERSSLTSTFAPAGRLPFFERSAPAFAIKSC